MLWTFGRGRATVAVVPYSPASSRGSSGGGVSSGTANPAGPAAGDLFYRTDLRQLITYDGTRWVTVNLYAAPLAPQLNQAAAVFNAQIGTNQNYDWWVEEIQFEVYVIAPNTGAAFWTITANKSDPAAGATALGSVTTAADAAATRLNKKITVGAALGGSTAWPLIFATNAKTGAPGNVDYVGTVYYRLIVT